jgi:Glutathione synthase/Ribosomal protein S6 modification enzyme (glutaminyl transferase)
VLEIALATASKFATLVPDDLLLVDALAERNIRAHGVVWNDPAVRWSDYDAVVIRSCWDYHLAHAAFLAWIAELDSKGVRVFNPPALVRWNAEKTYLRDLSSSGVPVVPTRWIERGENSSLDAIMRDQQWGEVVVKPAISASAHDTWRTSASQAHDAENRFREMVSRGRVLVQPYLDVIAAEGEWSLLFYDGAYSHAALKRPKPGDFRVQVEHGGGSEVREPEGLAIEAARVALAAAEQGRERSLYARVDGCMVDGRFLLMELELIEPDLYLRGKPWAPARLADALVARIDGA